MQIRYEITPSDHLEMVIARRSRRGFKTFLSLIGLSLAVISFWYIDLAFSTFLVLVFAALSLIEIFLPSIIHRRIYRRNRRLFSERTVTFDDEGVKSISDIGQVEKNWRSFEKFRETRNLFLLFQTQDCVGIVPKRAFQTQADVAQFSTLLTSKIGRQ